MIAQYATIAAGGCYLVSAIDQGMKRNWLMCFVWCCYAAANCGMAFLNK